MEVRKVNARSYRRGSTGGMVHGSQKMIRKGRRHSMPAMKLRSPVASPLSKLEFKLDKEGKITIKTNVTAQGIPQALGSPRLNFKPMTSKGALEEETDTPSNSPHQGKKRPSYQLYDEETLESSKKIEQLEAEEDSVLMVKRDDEEDISEVKDAPRKDEEEAETEEKTSSFCTIL
eukprot:CAMPEP_0167760628 /NCGR_PEP_ID=MMETSP0110_2-20121227/11689_1 /TAXON_ID=629695 /ORGANISM="Gymnochlora sp., Strain CCMP2014" /LENGTH=174 /DNA_ID=CAMNT_0007647155 /DNA_START=1 /DNA_END=525 /DNA_ORIENTATION=-